MNRRVRFWLWALGAVLVFIWGNSLLPASASGALSSWLHQWISAFSPGGGGASTGDGLLRKAAHFTEFALLGTVLLRLARLRGKTASNAAALSIGLGFLAACLDELLQHFSPGRGPGFRDVCLDLAGVTAGVCLYLAGMFVRNHKINKYSNGGNSK